MLGLDLINYIDDQFKSNLSSRMKKPLEMTKEESNKIMSIQA